MTKTEGGEKKTKTTTQIPLLNLEYGQIVPGARIQQCTGENHLPWEERDIFVPMYLCIKVWKKRAFQTESFSAFPLMNQLKKKNKLRAVQVWNCHN